LCSRLLRQQERNHANTGIPFRPSIRALKIIELAQRGVHDAPTLTEMTLKELKHCLPYAGYPY
jgi:hypothetical protein